ncbi:MAG: dihydroneopterin aldolase [Bacteroidales bacterium]
MNTFIELDKIQIYAYHGVMEQERIVGNTFEVSLKVAYPFEAAMYSDNVEDTCNYAELYAIINEQMRIPSQLLEHVAQRIITATKAKFPKISSGEIKITKLNPPFKSQLAGVSVIIHF